MAHGPKSEHEESAKKIKRERENNEENQKLTRAQKIRRFIIGHTPEYTDYSRRQKVSYLIARFGAIGYAFACGLGTVAGALVAFTPPWSMIAAPIFFFTALFINWKMSRRDVPKIFIRIFGHKGIPGKYLFKSEDTDNPLVHATATTKGKIAISFGLIACLVCGLATAGMYYGLLVKAAAALGAFAFLASPWVVVPALVLFAFTLALLFAAGYSNLLLIKNKMARFKLLVKNMIKPNHAYYTRYINGQLTPAEHPPLIFKFYEKFKLKSKTEIQAMGIATAVMSVVALGLVILGMFLQVFSTQVGLQALLSNVGGYGLSFTLALMGFLARMPFYGIKAYATAQTMLHPFALLIKQSKDLAYRFVFGEQFKTGLTEAGPAKRLGARLLGLALVVVPVVFAIAKLATTIHDKRKMKHESAGAETEKKEKGSRWRWLYDNVIYQVIRLGNAVANGLFSWIGGEEKGSPLWINVAGTTGGTLSSFAAGEQTSYTTKKSYDYSGRKVIQGTENIDSTFGSADEILKTLQPNIPLASMNTHRPTVETPLLAGPGAFYQSPPPIGGPVGDPAPNQTHYTFTPATS